jgi:putative transposon-encoded protein
MSTNNINSFSHDAAKKIFPKSSVGYGKKQDHRKRNFIVRKKGTSTFHKPAKSLGTSAKNRLVQLFLGNEGKM